MKRFWMLALCLVLLAQAAVPALGEASLSVSPDWEEALEVSAAESEPNPEEVGEANLLVPDGVLGEYGEAEVPQSLTLGVKEKYTLAVPGAKFKSSKKSVATVSGKGVVTAKKKGSAAIAVSVDGEVIATVAVKVLAAPKKVTLSPTKLLLARGDTQPLKAVLPKKTASKLTWSSNKKSVATVDENGNVTGVSEGKATITVKTFNGKKATCAVTVQSPDAPTSVSFGFKTLNLGLKEAVIVAPQVNEGAKATFKWSSKNKKIAAVTQKGVITGKKKGSTKITVKTQNGLEATLTVKVLAAPKSVTVGPKTATVAVGGMTRLTAKLPKNTASQIAWESGDTDVAVVYPDGTVLGCAPGKARITGYTFNGKKDYCDVTVTGSAPEEDDLREMLLADWGEWKVTEVVTEGIHATTCGDFFTLHLREDSIGGFMVLRGPVTYTHDCHWTIVEGQLVVLDDENGDVIVLRPDMKKRKLVLEAEGATFIFTQGVDPAPYYYPKQNPTPEEVNGKWVADRVAFAVLGLNFKAEDIGYEATLEIKDETVRLRYPDGEQAREYTMKVWYSGDGLYPEESADRDIVYCYSLIPELGDMRCTICTETQDNVTVYFRRAE